MASRGVLVALRVCGSGVVLGLLCGSVGVILCGFCCRGSGVALWLLLLPLALDGFGAGLRSYGGIGGGSWCWFGGVSASQFVLAVLLPVSADLVGLRALAVLGGLALSQQDFFISIIGYRYCIIDNRISI